MRRGKIEDLSLTGRKNPQAVGQEEDKGRNMWME